MHIISHFSLTFILLALEIQQSVTNTGVVTVSDFRELLAGSSVDHKLDYKEQQGQGN